MPTRICCLQQPVREIDSDLWDGQWCDPVSYWLHLVGEWKMQLQWIRNCGGAAPSHQPTHAQMSWWLHLRRQGMLQGHSLVPTRLQLEPFWQSVLLPKHHSHTTRTCGYSSCPTTVQLCYYDSPAMQFGPGMQPSSTMFPACCNHCPALQPGTTL